jgi:N-methylhydantoinase A
MVAGYPVRVPMVDIQVIGAGGGSIAALDDAGALKIGPRSAGADPGPAGYGRGGQSATITDANLLLGRLNPASLLGGRLPVDLAAARQVLQEQVAAPLGMSLEAAAEGILRIANAGMARAIRSISTERGHDLRRFALFAYGGAGPLHAGDVARELGIPRMIVPTEPGTLCARGILHADLSFDLVQTRIVPVRPAAWAGIAAAFAELARSAAEILDREHVPEADRRTLYGIDARYEGQNFEVHVALDGLALGSDASEFDREFAERFRAAHRAAYGYDIPGRVVEIVTLRLKMIGAVNKPNLAAPAAEGIRGRSETGRRPVYFDQTVGWIEVPIHDRSRLPIGAEIAGPAVIEEMSATTLLHPGQCATTDAAGNLIMTVPPE